MAKSKSAASVKASREAAGIKSTSVYVSEAEKALWKAVAAARGESLKDALVAGLRALQSGAEPTPEEALRILGRALGAARLTGVSVTEVSSAMRPLQPSAKITRSNDGITPAMIQAGVAVLREWLDEDRFMSRDPDLVRAIFEACLLARQGQGHAGE